MRKIVCLAVSLVAVLTLTLLAACTGASRDLVSQTGTVRFIDLEGGFYGIVADNGEHYDPINLGQEFRQDGLRVRFQAKIRQDIASIRMWGKIVEIIRIAKLP